MASPSEKLREESPTKENLNTRRKIAMITAVTIFTFSGGIAGFGSGLINAALNDLPTLASRTSELLRKNICIEDCATYIIANSGRYDICKQSVRQGLESLVKDTAIVNRTAAIV